jgi:hypothetical protein
MSDIKTLSIHAVDEGNTLFNYVGLPLAMAGGGALLGAGLGAAHHPISEAFETDKSPEGRLQRLKQKLVSGSIGGAGAGLGVLLSRAINQHLDKAAASRCWTGYEPVPGKTPYSEDSCRPIGSKPKKKKEKKANCGCSSQKCDNCGTAPCECNSDVDVTRLAKIAAYIFKQAEGGAWTRSEGKSESGGLNAKGRASLKAQGHDIKPPVTESNPTGERAGRKTKFCARMQGTKEKRTSAETAKDPESRINKSLRKWKC